MFSKKRVYLDFAAGTEGNPSSAHEEGRTQKARLEAAREALARLLECKADDVIFTSGATEANALAILGLAKPGAHLLYLPSAHASVVENMKLAESRGARIEPLPIRDGKVDTDALAKRIKKETVLVSMDAVCGETGVIWNTREVRQTLDAARSADEPRIYLHVDASQAPFTENLTRAHFGADLMTLDGGKVGARGAGCLVAHRTIPLAPFYGGGGQERGLISGTENVEAIERFVESLARVAADRERFHARACALRAGLLSNIGGIANLEVNEEAAQAPHVLNISLLGRDTDYIVALLDEAGFAVSTRSACETDSETGSRAVVALTNDAGRAVSTLRISWGPAVSERSLARFAQALIKAVEFVDKNALA